MPAYIWVGTTKAGAKQKGEMEAASEEAVREHLKRQKITPTKVKPKPKDLFENVAFMQPKVDQKTIIVFCRQFSTMIDAGLPIVQCLDILMSQEENATFKKVLRTIKEAVEGGQTLADALKQHPKHFDNLFTNMVAAGEAGGILDQILQRLSAYMEKAARLKKQIKGAMTYPVITLVVAVVVVLVILVFVIPVFEEMFATMGGALPAPTQMVVNMSEFMQKNVVYILIGIGLFVFTLTRIYKTEKGRLYIDGLLLKIPIIGPLLRKTAVARFTQTMGTLLSSGVSILDALDIVAKTAGNKVVENGILHVRSGITEGRTVADPLMETGVFPSMVCQMVAVGESTGALDAMLEKIADFYEEEVDAAVDALTSAIEPLMMVFLGGVCGGLLISMYLPIFTMAGNL